MKRRYVKFLVVIALVATFSSHLQAGLWARFKEAQKEMNEATVRYNDCVSTKCGVAKRAREKAYGAYTLNRFTGLEPGKLIELRLKYNKATSRYNLCRNRMCREEKNKLVETSNRVGKYAAGFAVAIELGMIGTILGTAVAVTGTVEYLESREQKKEDEARRLLEVKIGMKRRSMPIFKDVGIQTEPPKDVGTQTEEIGETEREWGKATPGFQESELMWEGRLPEAK